MTTCFKTVFSSFSVAAVSFFILLTTFSCQEKVVKVRPPPPKPIQYTFSLNAPFTSKDGYSIQNANIEVSFEIYYDNLQNFSYVATFEKTGNYLPLKFSTAANASERGASDGVFYWVTGTQDTLFKFDQGPMVILKRDASRETLLEDYIGDNEVRFNAYIACKSKDFTGCRLLKESAFVDLSGSKKFAILKETTPINITKK